jgi:rhodanese-related sulfurtransferase
MSSLKPFVLCLFLPLLAWAENDPLRDALQEFMEFADYSEGAITAEQLNNLGLHTFLLIDTRMADQFATFHLPGAVHIEWREVIARQDEIPIDRPVLLYCDTGLLSSKAHFALRLLGYDKVKVLFGGLNGWKLHQGLRTTAP